MEARNSIPPALIKQIQEGNVALFIGAGLSINCGYPSWEGLLHTLGKTYIEPTDKCAADFYNSLDGLSKAQYLFDQCGRVNIVGTIRDLFKPKTGNPSLVHKVIPHLPVNIIITTNWDNLIEDAFAANGIQCAKIWKDDQLSSLNMHEKKIIKLHGTIEDTDSIVFSEDDYVNIFIKNPLLEKYISSTLAQMTFLFLGYSYRDFDFKGVKAFVSHSLKNMFLDMYSLSINASPQQIAFSEGRGLKCINFTAADRSDALIKFFRKLEKKTSAFADTSKKRLQIMNRESSRILRSNRTGLMLRNMAAMSPLAVPDNAEKYPNLFGDDTLLEIKCANNWRKILEKPDSQAKIILSFSVEYRMKIFAGRDTYLVRIETLINNIENYWNKIDVVDFGAPFVMQHYDIYDDLLLESFKMDITKYGYGRLQLYRDKKIISKRTETFDSVFESIRLMNLQQAEDEIGVTCSDEDDEEKKKETTKKLILHRLNKIREILGG